MNLKSLLAKYCHYTHILDILVVFIVWTNDFELASVDDLNQLITNVIKQDKIHGLCVKNKNTDLKKLLEEISLSIYFENENLY
jgi:hypothetical protein